jgi:hypothetical protein
MTKHVDNAKRFATIMEKAGASVHWTRAGTGTVYVTINDSFKARFADHGECYCREDISVDPDGCTLEQAVRAAGRETGVDVSKALAVMNRAAKAANTRKANDDARFEAKMARRDAAAARYMAANPSASMLDALKATMAEWA